MINGDQEASLIEQLAPGWAIRFAPIWDDGEHFWWQRQLVVIDDAVQDRERAQVHAAAHVALGHRHMVGEEFTDEQEGWADTLADILIGDSRDWAETG